MEEQQDLIIEINYGKIKNGNTLKLDLCIPYIYIFFSPFSSGSIKRKAENSGQEKR